MLHMRNLLTAAIASLALAAPAGAADLPIPAPAGAMQAAQQIALAHWAATPCNGQVTVTWAHLGTGINAHATWFVPSSMPNVPASYTNCSLTMSLDVAWDWPKLCTIVEHELGHLTGHEHTATDSTDVMSPTYLAPVAECMTEPSAPAAAPAPAVKAAAAPAHKAKAKAKARPRPSRKLRATRLAWHTR